MPLHGQSGFKHPAPVNNVVGKDAVIPPPGSQPHENPQPGQQTVVTPPKVEVSEENKAEAAAVPLPTVELREPEEAPVRPATKEDIARLQHIKDVDFLRDASIEARPLFMPDTLNVTPRHTEYAYRWVNRKGQDGSWFSRMQAIGFQPATHEDVFVESLHPECNLADGKIIMGDVILMKINKIKYLGALKYNDQRARMLTTRTGIMKGAIDQARSSLISDVGFYPEGKVDFFVPSAKDVEAKVGK